MTGFSDAEIPWMVLGRDVRVALGLALETGLAGKHLARVRWADVDLASRRLRRGRAGLALSGQAVDELGRLRPKHSWPRPPGSAGGSRRLIDGAHPTGRVFRSLVEPVDCFDGGDPIALFDRLRIEPVPAEARRLFARYRWEPGPWALATIGIWWREAEGEFRAVVRPELAAKRGRIPRDAYGEISKRVEWLREALSDARGEGRAQPRVELAFDSLAGIIRAHRPLSRGGQGTTATASTFDLDAPPPSVVAADFSRDLIARFGFDAALADRLAHACAKAANARVTLDAVRKARRRSRSSFWSHRQNS